MQEVALRLFIAVGYLKQKMILWLSENLTNDHLHNYCLST